MNRKEKIRLLTEIANGTKSTTSLLPRRDEVWTTKSILQEDGWKWSEIYMRDGVELSTVQFNEYKAANPQLSPLVVHVYDTGIPLASSEGEVLERWENEEDKQRMEWSMKHRT